jgi:hypothetical protein
MLAFLEQQKQAARAAANQQSAAAPTASSFSATATSVPPPPPPQPVDDTDEQWFKDNNIDPWAVPLNSPAPLFWQWPPVVPMTPRGGASLCRPGCRRDCRLLGQDATTFRQLAAVFYLRGADGAPLVLQVHVGFKPAAPTQEIDSDGASAPATATAAATPAAPAHEPIVTVSVASAQTESELSVLMRQILFSATHDIDQVNLPFFLEDADAEHLLRHPVAGLKSGATLARRQRDDAGRWQWQSLDQWTADDVQGLESRPDTALVVPREHTTFKHFNVTWGRHWLFNRQSWDNALREEMGKLGLALPPAFDKSRVRSRKAAAATKDSSSAQQQIVAAMISS